MRKHVALRTVGATRTGQWQLWPPLEAIPQSPALWAGIIYFTTRKKLQEYERLRDRYCRHPKSPSFFLSERGTRLTDCTVRRWFIITSRRIGLRAPTDRRGPRIHDLRHLYAFKTILNWYRRGMDVEAHLPELTTYMGHGHVADTYWYISAAPELLKLATQRLERQKGGASA